jgi:hypothetical protein
MTSFLLLPVANFRCCELVFLWQEEHGSGGFIDKWPKLFMPIYSFEGQDLYIHQRKEYIIPILFQHDK